MAIFKSEGLNIAFGIQKMNIVSWESIFKSKDLNILLGSQYSKQKIVLGSNIQIQIFEFENCSWETHSNEKIG